jgi:hypothetical protein
LFRKRLWSFQSIHTELAKLYSKKVIFRMVCPANLWAGTEMVNPDRTQRQTGHSLLQFGGDSMSTELATNWTPAEKIPPAKPHALALFPVNDTERAEQFVKLFADELRLRARTETLVVVGNRLWRTVYLSKLPGLDKKIRVAFDWTLDLLFPKDVCAVYDLDNSRDFEKDNIQLGPQEASEGCALVERV